MTTFSQGLVNKDTGNINTSMLLFVFLIFIISGSPLAAIAVASTYLIGRDHGEREAFPSGYSEGMKEGFKQSSTFINEIQKAIFSLLVVVFIVGVFLGFGFSKLIF